MTRPDAEPLSRLIAAIGRFRLRRSDEHELQDAIEELLKAEQIPYEREVQLGEHDRADFMVGTAAVEVKTQGSHSEVARQLLRYARHEQVGCVVLISTKLGHAAMPLRLLGKRVIALYVSSL